MLFRELLLSITILGAFSSFAGSNVLKNPDFENGLKNWTIRVASNADVSFKVVPKGINGSKCLEITNKTKRAPQHYGRVYQVIPVIPETRYRISFKIKSKKASGIDFAGGKGWKVRQDAPSGTYDWKEVVHIYTTKPNEKHFTFNLISEDVAEKVWIDDVHFDNMNLLDAATSARLKIKPVSKMGSCKFYPAPKSDKIQIDANLSDWNDDFFITIPKSDPKDLSTQVALAYDEKNFHMAVKNIDNVHNAFTGEDMWLGDSIQFAFAEDGRYGPEYGISVVDGKPSLWCWNEGDRVLKNDALTISMKKDGNKTNYEVSIPWKAIFATGKPSEKFKFCLLANDNDGQGRKGWIEWTSGIAKGKDPFNFAHVFLTDNKPGVFIRSSKRKSILNDKIKYYVYAFNPTARKIKDNLKLPFLEKELNIPAYSVAVVTYDKKLKNKGANTTKVEFAGKYAQCAVNATGYSKETLEKDLKKVADELPELNNLLEKCKARKLTTDYQTVDIVTIRIFVPYVNEDIHRQYYSRAHWAIGELNKIAVRAKTQLEGILNGERKTVDIPRYVSSKITADGLTFKAETVTASDPKPKERPLFLVGYGHFGSVKRDIPIFPSLGTNIIQVEQGPSAAIKPPRDANEEFFVDMNAYKGIVKLLKKAEKNNVTVCLLLSPHYFPGWALKKYPELNNYKGGFLRYTINNPIAKKIIKANLEALIPLVKDSPALQSICLSNEPVYKDSSKDKYTQALWAEYLKKKHKNISELNSIYKKKYKSFKDVPIPRFDLRNQTAAYYDWCMFNDRRFADWHKWMADIVHSIAPNLPCHSKLMACPFDYNDGISPEEFKTSNDYNGCDASSYYKYQSDKPSLNKMMWYEILRSVKHVPVINTEDHVIADRDTRYIPEQAKHIRSDLWMGAVCGRGASILWVWERVYDRYSDLSDSILNRPDCVATVGRTALDLNRLVSKFKLLQEVPKKVAVVYSRTAIIHDKTYPDSTRDIYEKLVYSGIAPDFVTEEEILAGKLDKYETVILPSTSYMRDDVVEKLRQFADRGKLICTGDIPVFDQYIRPIVCHFSKFSKSMDTVKNQYGVSTDFDDSARVWWRAAKDGNDILVTAVNLGDHDLSANFECKGRKVSEKLLRMEPVLFKIPGK